MRNLKRTLSLVLAAMMLISMMVVSAGAASKDFTDSSEIQNKEAVNTMVTLNVISGKNDGSYFDPTGTLTREEMAKIVSYVMNGGVEPVVGTKVTPTYSDIKGIWSEKYIEYCSSMGIIVGDGTGKFNPTGTLTAEQCAKMFLTAMGYDANVFGFTGNSWAINVGRYANEAGLYKNLGDVVPSQPISRDDACQMAYNAIQATMMKRSWSQDMTTGQLTETYVPWVENGVTHTLFTEKFNGTTYEGVLRTSGEYGILGVTTSPDTFTVNAEKVNGNTPAAIVDKSFTWKNTDLTALVGNYVKVLYNNKTEEIYGVYGVAEKNAVDVSTTANKVSLDGGKIKVDGNSYSYESGNIVFVDGANGVAVSGASAYIASTAVAKADNVRLISNNGDSKIDVILVNTISVTKVPYVGASDFTVSTPAVGSRPITTTGVADLGTYAKAAQKLEDVNTYEGMAKDDYVILSENYYTEEDVVSKVEVTTGTITGTKSGQWQIDGEWYKPYAGYTGMNVLGNGDTLNYIAINGIVYFAEKTTANSVKDIAAVITMGVTTSSNNVTGNTLEAKLLLADGTKKTVSVSKIGTTAITSANATAQCSANINLIGDLVTYKVDNNGKYELTSIPGNSTTKSAIANYEYSLNSASGTQYVATTKTIAGYTLSDDAVVFVVHTEAANTADALNDGKIFTGKEIKRLAANFGGTNTSISNTPGLVTTSNGISEVAVAVLSTTDAIPTITGAGTSYGYLTSGTYRTHDATTGKDYNVFTYWDGTQVVTAKEESTTSKIGATAGQVIGFDTVSEGVIKNVSVVGATGRVSGYSADKNSLQLVEVSGTYKITNDTTILYVDTDAVEGRTGGSIVLASDLDGNGSLDVNNVRYILNAGTQEVELLVVDVNNNFQGASKAATTTTWSSVSAINALLASYDVVEVSDAATLDANLTVPAGKTVKFQNTLNTNSKTVTVNGTLEITGAVTGPNMITVTDKGTVNLLGAACATGTVEGITPVLGATVTVDTAVSGLTQVYSSVGTPTGTTPNTGTAGTTTSSVNAGTTLKGATVYTNTNSATAVKWLVQ